MARGITETDVHTAADELVAAGERPTVERIRAHLGMGSPNTVVRYLDSWWRLLGERLHAEGDRGTLPAVPEDLSALAMQWWEAAVSHAKRVTLESLAQEYAALAQERQQLEEDRLAMAGQLQDAQDTAARANHALELAQAQVVQGERLAEQQAKQLADLARQRDALQQRTESLEQSKGELRQRLEQLAEVAAHEREEQAAHQRSIEDRASSEIDRARQETRELRAQRVTERREQAALERQLRLDRDQALEKAAAALRKQAVGSCSNSAICLRLCRLR
jgi:outer membrane murein-binding lipoprotein Lpp